MPSTYAVEEGYVMEDGQYIDEETQSLMYTLQLSKTIRTLAVIDIVFTLLYLFYDYYLLIPLLLAWTGYIGAKNNPTMIQLVLSSLFFLVSLYIIRFINIFCNRIKDHTESELFRLKNGEFNVAYLVW